MIRQTLTCSEHDPIPQAREEQTRAQEGWAAEREELVRRAEDAEGALQLCQSQQGDWRAKQQEALRAFWLQIEGGCRTLNDSLAGETV